MTGGGGVGAGGFLKPNPQTRADIHRTDVAVMVVKPAGDRAGGMPDRPFLYSAPAGIGAEGVEAEAAEDLLRHVELGAGAEYPGKGDSGSGRADYREPRCRTGRCFHYLMGERSGAAFRLVSAALRPLNDRTARAVGIAGSPAAGRLRTCPPGGRLHCMRPTAHRPWRGCRVCCC